jgi:undecaprenyl-diphosphatase
MVILGLAVFGVMAALAATGQMQEEAAMLRWFEGQRSSSGTSAVLAITRFGAGPTTAAITTLLCVWMLIRKQTQEAVFLATANFGASMVNAALKVTFERQRPTSEIVSSLMDPQSFSFPSGHAMSAMVLYTSISIVAARLGGTAVRTMVMALALIMIPTMGFTRLYLGVHYPTDVMGGWALGAAWVSLSYLVFYQTPWTYQ